MSNGVLVAIDRLGLKHSIVAALRAANVDATVLADSRSLRQIDLAPNQLVILETGDDIAALVQRTYELYERLGDTRETRPQIAAIVSRSVAHLHPALSWWEIHGHAALACLAMRENPDLAQELVSLFRRLIRLRAG